MNDASIGSSFTHFIFKFIELSQYFDWDPDVVIFKRKKALRVVEKDVGIEDVVFQRLKLCDGLA